LFLITLPFLFAETLSIQSIHFVNEEFLEFSLHQPPLEIKIYKENDSSLQFTKIQEKNTSNYLFVGSAFTQKYADILDQLNCTIFQSSKSQLVFGGFKTNGESFTIEMVLNLSSQTISQTNQTIQTNQSNENETENQSYQNKTIFYFYNITPQAPIENTSWYITTENTSQLLPKPFEVCNYNFSNMYQNQSIDNLTIEINQSFENTTLTPPINHTQTNQSSNQEEQTKEQSSSSSSQSSSQSYITQIEITAIKNITEYTKEISFTITKGDTRKRAVYFSLNNKKFFTIYVSQNTKTSGKILLYLEENKQNYFEMKGLDQNISLMFTTKPRVKHNTTNSSLDMTQNILEFSEPKHIGRTLFLSVYSSINIRTQCSLYLYTKKQIDFLQENSSKLSLLSFTLPESYEIKNSSLYTLKCMFNDVKVSFPLVNLYNSTKEMYLEENRTFLLTNNNTNTSQNLKKTIKNSSQVDNENNSNSSENANQTMLYSNQSKETSSFTQWIVLLFLLLSIVVGLIFFK
jgi:hypothetical protein